MKDFQAEKQTQTKKGKRRSQNSATLSLSDRTNTKWKSHHGARKEKKETKGKEGKREGGSQRYLMEWPWRKKR
jgi:hypothetical protein